SQDEIPPPPPPPSSIKLPILKKGEYDIWAMKMEHYLAHTDYPIWEVIENGNGPVINSQQSLAIKSRFGGNDESKKMQKYILNAKCEGFMLSKNSEGLHKGYDRFQSLLSQLEIHGEGVSTEDANQKFLRSLPSASFSRLDHEDLEQLDEFDLEEMDLKWQTGHFARECRTKGNQDSRRRDAWNSGNKDGRRSGKQEDSKDLVTIDGEGVDWTSHSKEEEDYALMACNSSGLDTEDLDDKTDVLTYHKKLLAEVEKEKEDLKAKVEKWHNSSKNLSKLLNTQMSGNDTFGLGYGDYRYNGILSYENEVLQSVFMNKESDLENQPLYDRCVTAEGMHAVAPPMTGNYMPSRPDIEIDYSQFTYGLKFSKPSESETQTIDFDTCESNISVETSEFYESDSEDEHVSLPTEEHETPSFANNQVKTPRETVKNQFTHSKNPKVDNKGLGYGFTTKACFVCGSLSHLIRDCDFHEKRMAKQAELNNRMSKKSSQREIRTIWNNVQRLNHQNQFVPTAVLTRTSRIPVNTGRQNLSSQTATTSTAKKVNTARPIVDEIRPRNNFYKSHSPIRMPFN
ncbi:hypothetical protein Tco_0648487, partial [Tanacetum coccineum]